MTLYTQTWSLPFKRLIQRTSPVSTIHFVFFKLHCRFHKLVTFKFLDFATFSRSNTLHNFRGQNIFRCPNLLRKLFPRWMQMHRSKTSSCEIFSFLCLKPHTFSSQTKIYSKLWLGDVRSRINAGIMWNQECNFAINSFQVFSSSTLRS